MTLLTLVKILVAIELSTCAPYMLFQLFKIRQEGKPTLVAFLSNKSTLNLVRFWLSYLTWFGIIIIVSTETLVFLYNTIASLLDSIKIF